MNLASRLKSDGTPGRIHVSERTRRLLQPGYRFEPRGLIELKCIGTLCTSFLTDRKPCAGDTLRDPNLERDAGSSRSDLCAPETDLAFQRATTLLRDRRGEIEGLLKLLEESGPEWVGIPHLGAVGFSAFSGGRGR